MTAADAPVTPLRRPHLKDVAKLSGVSFQTVSRALNNGPRVSPQTRARVLAAAEQLGYRPNVAARALATGRGSLVAAFVPDTVRFDYAGGLSGLEEAVRTVGLTVAITVLPDQGQRARDAVTQVTAQPLAGAVVFSFDEGGRTILDALPPDIPLVVLGGRPGDATLQVLLDEYSGGRNATEHLLALGHTTVHHLSLPDFGIPWPRVRGWRDALLTAGAPIPDRIQVGWSVDDARRSAAAVLEAGATAVLCGNDDVALGLMRGLAERGIDVPGQMSIVGFDDIPYARVWRPALTTVRQDFVRLGAIAFELLERHMAGESESRVEILQTELVLRESTAEPRPRVARRPALTE